MNLFARPFWVAVCLLVGSWAGHDVCALSIPANITSSPAISAQQKQTIAAAVDPQMAQLIGSDTEETAKARKDLARALNDPAATAAFQDALSQTIASKIKPAATHEDEAVRLNTVILLASMTDDGSKAYIDAAVNDKSVAVQRWAIKALGQRVATWSARTAGANGTLPAQTQAQIAGVVKQIKTKLDQSPAPHPIVVGAALTLLIDVDTAGSRALLMDQLNKRLALHAAEPGLSYSGELVAIDRYARLLLTNPTFEESSAAQFNRATYRYATLILEHIKQKQYNQEQAEGAYAMLFQCVQALGITTARAGKNTPPNQTQLKSWVGNGQWGELSGMLVNEWPPILSAEPFGLKAEDLAVQ